MLTKGMQTQSGPATLQGGGAVGKYWMPTPTSVLSGSFTNAVSADWIAVHFDPTGVSWFIDPDWSYMMNMSNGLSVVISFVTGTSTIFVVCSAFEPVAKQPPSV